MFSPNFDRRSDSQVVSGQIMPSQDCKTTKPVPDKCVNRNHGLLTHSQDRNLPRKMRIKPSTIKTTNNTWVISMASAIKE